MSYTVMGLNLIKQFNILLNISFDPKKKEVLPFSKRLLFSVIPKPNPNQVSCFYNNIANNGFRPFKVVTEFLAQVQCIYMMVM